MDYIKTLFFFILLSVLAGCSNMPKEKVLERNGISIITVNPGTKMAILKDSASMERVCAARESDFAKTSSFGVGLSDRLGDGIEEKDTHGVMSLGGRDASLLILRELTYRACEMSLNLNLNQEDTKQVYLHFLSLAKEMMKNNSIQGTAVLDSTVNQVSLPDFKKKDDDDDDAG